MIKINIAGVRVSLLGDTHLGKRFERGVPLNRRGDREKMQRADFIRSLQDVSDVDVHVQMGDLFDQWFVSYGWIWFAAQSYREAAAANSRVQYYLLIGNHDASRDLERVSAFQIFAGLIADLDNVTVVQDSPMAYMPLRPATNSAAKLVFVPWHPEHTAEEMVRMHAHIIRDADATFHHCDVVAIHATDNLLPTKALAELGVKRAITGHDHNKREIVLDGVPVFVTGSMQPYSHAEDEEGNLYVTVTMKQLEEDYTEGELRDKCVRIRLKPGEKLDFPLDCLQITLDPESAAQTDDDGEVEVEFTAFNFEQLFTECMREAEVDDDFIEQTKTRWDTEKAKAA